MSDLKPPGATTRPLGKPGQGRPVPAPVEGDWSGAFVGRRRDGAEVTLLAPLRRSNAGGSGAFLGSANDRHRYWIKPLNNGQTARVCVTEQIVGRVASLIDAPACPVRTIEIPVGLAGWQFREGLGLEPGIAHASLETPNALETGVLEKRRDDANASRHAYLLALYDLCWGDDPQWLMDLGDDFRFYSHDHGLYLPQGPYWTIADLRRCVAAPREYDRGNEAGIDLAAVAGVIGKLRDLTQPAVVEALSALPNGWPVTDAELEMVGHFIFSRATAVAARLEARFLAGAT